MPLSKQHKADTRQRIVTSAGRAFRRQGSESASVAAVMADAGLTHGGFYAHFRSKQDLLREVMTNDHGFIRLLERRRPGAPAVWKRQTLKVFADYLTPAYLSEVGAGCSFAALTGDAARADDAVREGYRQAWRRLIGEVLRAPQQEPIAAWEQASTVARQGASAVMGMAIGAVSLARVLAPDPTAALLLRGMAPTVALQVESLLDEHWPDSSRSDGKRARR